jgi:hypothetical protein
MIKFPDFYDMGYYEETCAFMKNFDCEAKVAPYRASITGYTIFLYFTVHCYRHQHLTNIMSNHGKAYLFLSSCFTNPLTLFLLKTNKKMCFCYFFPYLSHNNKFQWHRELFTPFLSKKCEFRQLKVSVSQAVFHTFLVKAGVNSSNSRCQCQRQLFTPSLSKQV